MRKRSKPVTKRQILERQLETLQRLIVIKRDRGCVLRDIHPHNCSSTLQADHLISRTHKSIFFDLRNLNCVCKTINGIKGKQWNGHQKIQRELEKITEERYGKGTVDELYELSSNRYNFDIDWFESKISEYTSQL